MEERILILILQLVKFKGDTNILLDYGLDYAQITRYLRYMKKSFFVCYINDDLEITKEGEKELKRLNKQLGRKNADQWISPQEKYLIEKKDKFTVYLP